MRFFSLLGHFGIPSVDFSEKPQPVTKNVSFIESIAAETSHTFSPLSSVALQTVRSQLKQIWICSGILWNHRHTDHFYRKQVVF